MNAQNISGQQNRQAPNNGRQTDAFLTRGGARPDISELSYHLSTSEMRNFLQKKLDEIADGDQVQIKLISVDIGNNFIPFVAILPSAVLVDDKKENENDDVMKLDIDLDESSTSKYIKMKEKYFKLVSAYTYNKDERDSFKAENVRKIYGLKPNTAFNLRKLMIPRKFDKEGDSVIVLLDPIKLFHSYLSISNDNRPFEVDIVGVKKKGNGEFSYHVKRKLSSGKNKKGYDIYKFISQQLRQN